MSYHNFCDDINDDDDVANDEGDDVTNDDDDVANDDGDDVTSDDDSGVANDDGDALCGWWLLIDDIMYCKFPWSLAN